MESRHFTECVYSACSYFFSVILSIQLERVAGEQACLCLSKAVTPDIFHQAGRLQVTISFQTAYQVY